MSPKNSFLQPTSTLLNGTSSILVACLMTRELTEHQIAQRQKQIDLGYSTIGYMRYRHCVRKDHRNKKWQHSWHPVTPNSRDNHYSIRAFQGLIRKWRTCLHWWGNLDEDTYSYLCMTSSNRDPASITSSELESSPFNKDDENLNANESRVLYPWNKMQHIDVTMAPPRSPVSSILTSAPLQDGFNGVGGRNWYNPGKTIPSNLYAGLAISKSSYPFLPEHRQCLTTGCWFEQQPKQTDFMVTSSDAFPPIDHKGDANVWFQGELATGRRLSEKLESREQQLRVALDTSVLSSIPSSETLNNISLVSTNSQNEVSQRSSPTTKQQLLSFILSTNKKNHREKGRRKKKGPSERTNSLISEWINVPPIYELSELLVLKKPFQVVDGARRSSKISKTLSQRLLTGLVLGEREPEYHTAISNRIQRSDAEESSEKNIFASPQNTYPAKKSNGLNESEQALKLDRPVAFIPQQYRGMQIWPRCYFIKEEDFIEVLRYPTTQHHVSTMERHLGHPPKILASPISTASTSPLNRNKKNEITPLPSRYTSTALSTGSELRKTTIAEKAVVLTQLQHQSLSDQIRMSNRPPPIIHNDHVLSYQSSVDVIGLSSYPISKESSIPIKNQCNTKPLTFTTLPEPVTQRYSNFQVQYGVSWGRSRFKRF